MLPHSYNKKKIQMRWPHRYEKKNRKYPKPDIDLIYFPLWHIFSLCLFLFYLFIIINTNSAYTTLNKKKQQ